MENMETFADIIAKNYDEIKRKLISGLKNKNYEFDEDLMHDTILCCLTSLKDKLITKEEAIKYFWTSYINKLKSISTKPIVYIEDMIDGDDEEINYDEFGASETYNKDIDNIYNYIVDKLEEKFGEYVTSLWKEHEFNHIQIKQLKEKDNRIEYHLKRIRLYINKLVKQDEYLIETIKQFK